MSTFYAPAPGGIGPRQPSAYQLERSVSLWQQLRQALTEDPELPTDEGAMVRWLETPDGDVVPAPHILLARLVDAAIWAERREAESAEMQKRFAARRDRYEERGKKIRATIQQLMEALDVKAAEGELGSVSLVREAVRVLITDETKLGLDYIRVKSEPDKIAIGKALKAGTPVDGAELSNPGIIPRITPF